MTRRYWSACVAAARLMGQASLIGGHSATSVATPMASDPLATPAAQTELNWLANLPNPSSTHRVVSGYFGGYSGTADPRTGKNWASELQEITGIGPTPNVLTPTARQPVILPFDYGAGRANPAHVPTTTSPSSNSSLPTR